MSGCSPAVPDTQRFLTELRQSLSPLSLQKLVLSRYQGSDAGLQRLTVRPVLLRQESHLSFVYSYQTRDVTQNFTPDAGLVAIAGLLGTDFKQANLLCRHTEIQLGFSKKGKPLYSQKNLIPASQAAGGEEQNTGANLTHNRDKHRYLDIQRPFLFELGVTDKHHQLIPSMSRKWKQINKFIEILATAIRDAGLENKGTLHVADFGSGKAYLTFAVHDYLTNTLGLDAEVIGVELRQNLVDLCNHTAAKLALQGIRFEQGDVQHFQALGIHVMIALHACDTATDYAIHMGIRTGADIIICSPCCHKQIRPQMHPPKVLSPLLMHGIHLGQEAEMVTDSLRALLLEAHGYDTKVFEFISLEHTSKNKMILATRRKQPRDNSAMLQQIVDIKAFYGIKEHCLETLLQAG